MIDERHQFENQLFDLRKLVLDGLSYFVVWQALNKQYQDSHAIPHDTRNPSWRYRGFIAPARNALLWSTLLQLSKVFDTDPRTISFHNLVVKARNDQKELAPYATQDSLEDIQVRILRSEGLLQKLRRYRNRRLTHMDSTQNENVTFPFERLDILVGEMKVIFNELKFSCDGNRDDFADIMLDVSTHTSQVIDILSRS